MGFLSKINYHALSSKIYVFLCKHFARRQNRFGVLNVSMFALLYLLPIYRITEEKRFICLSFLCLICQSLGYRLHQQSEHGKETVVFYYMRYTEASWHEINLAIGNRDSLRPPAYCRVLCNIILCKTTKGLTVYHVYCLSLFGMSI